MNLPSRLLTLLASLAVLGAQAHGPNDPPHRKFSLGDFKLESGEVIRDFEISYVTQGTLNADKSNAVLLVTAIGGNHHRLDWLIGPDRAIDPSKYFVIATDAIGNGLSTSPSNSKAQPGMRFPRFNIRDMVNSQERLVREKFGIKKLLTVMGASMGGMQALQWGVSYPAMMDSLVPIIPLGRTPAWTTAVLEMLRQGIMSDPNWKDGNYTPDAPPEMGMRLWAGWLSGTIVRTPISHSTDFPHNMDVVPWLRKLQDASWKRIDARDWVYQSWAYDQHNLGTSPGFNGDYYMALRSIKAKTLVLAGEGDLLNPEAEARDATNHIADARYVTIKPRIAYGHLSGAGATVPEIEFANTEISKFLEVVTSQRARK